MCILAAARMGGIASRVSLRHASGAERSLPYFNFRRAAAEHMSIRRAAVRAGLPRTHIQVHKQGRTGYSVYF